MKKIKPLFNASVKDVEFFEIFDEDGKPTGQMQPRGVVHRKGLLHGASHIWIVRKEDNGAVKVLVQKRCEDKDSFPGCFDCSSAGHVDAGETFEEAALRELKEELGISATQAELRFLFFQHVHGDNIFHGRRFINNEINAVYMLEKEVNIEDIVFEPKEIAGVEWQDLDEILKILEAGDDGPSTGYCMWKDEVLKVRQMCQTDS